MSTFLHYVHCKDALLDCSAPGGERCGSLTWVDEIGFTHKGTRPLCKQLMVRFHWCYLHTYVVVFSEPMIAKCDCSSQKFTCIMSCSPIITISFIPTVQTPLMWPPTSVLWSFISPRKSGPYVAGNHGPYLCINMDGTRWCQHTWDEDFKTTRHLWSFTMHGERSQVQGVLKSSSWTVWNIQESICGWNKDDINCLRPAFSFYMIIGPWKSGPYVAGNHGPYLCINMDGTRWCQHTWDEDFKTPGICDLSPCMVKDLRSRVFWYLHHKLFEIFRNQSVDGTKMILTLCGLGSVLIWWPFSRYRDSHHKGKIVMRVSYLYNGNYHIIFYIDMVMHICVSELGHHWFR